MSHARNRRALPCTNYVLSILLVLIMSCKKSSERMEILAKISYSNSALIDCQFSTQTVNSYVKCITYLTKFMKYLYFDKTMNENKQFSCFQYSSVDPVTSHFISRRIGLIQILFRCEIGVSTNISISTYTIAVKFSG